MLVSYLMHAYIFISIFDAMLFYFIFRSMLLIIIKFGRRIHLYLQDVIQ